MERPGPAGPGLVCRAGGQARSLRARAQPIGYQGLGVKKSPAPVQYLLVLPPPPILSISRGPWASGWVTETALTRVQSLPRGSGFMVSSPAAPGRGAWGTPGSLAEGARWQPSQGDPPSLRAGTRGGRGGGFPTYAFHQRDLPGYSSLNKKGQPGAAARRAVLAQQALRERSRAVSQRAQQGSGTVTPQATLDPSTCSLHPFGDLGTRARGALR